MTWLHYVLKCFSLNQLKKFSPIKGVSLRIIFQSTVKKSDHSVSWKCHLKSTFKAWLPWHILLHKLKEIQNGDVSIRIPMPGHPDCTSLKTTMVCKALCLLPTFMVKTKCQNAWWLMLPSKPICLHLFHRTRVFFILLFPRYQTSPYPGNLNWNPHSISVDMNNLCIFNASAFAVTISMLLEADCLCHTNKAVQESTKKLNVEWRSRLTRGQAALWSTDCLMRANW